MRVLVIAAAIFIGTAATAQPPASPPSQGSEPAQPTSAASPDVITNPDWLEVPSADELGAAYPRLALQNNWSGEVRMRCRVAANGFVTGCTVVSENPAGAGFGVATLSLAPRFRMRPQMRNGVPVSGASVVFPVNWNSGGHIPRAGEVQRALRADGPQRVSGLMVRPHWAAAPTWDQVREIAPDSEGVAVARCRVWQDGTLSQCNALSSTPAGGGLGRAAERLGHHFRISTEGLPPFDGEVQVDVPVAFTRTRPDYVARAAWEGLPTGAELEASLRAVAQAAPDRTARATLDCAIGAEGRLQDCRVTSATPAAAGPALLPLMSRFVAGPWSEDGYPTIGARVRLPLRYVAD